MDDTENKYTFNGSRVWKPEEREFLRLNYKSMNVQDIAVKLNRTVMSIRNQASLTAISLNRIWYQQDDDYLFALWYSETHNKKFYSFLARKLKRTVNSVVQRAAKLKLQFGIPNGSQSLLRGAKRAGMSHQLFTKIIKLYNVQINILPTKFDNKNLMNQYYVDQEEADTAIAAWCRADNKRYRK